MAMIGKFITPNILTGVTGVAGTAFNSTLPLIGMAGAGAAIKGIHKGAQATGVMYSPQVHGYGKRGLDSNNLNTDGLVQGLHNRRRTMR